MNRPFFLKSPNPETAYPSAHRSLESPVEALQANLQLELDLGAITVQEALESLHEGHKYFSVYQSDMGDTVILREPSDGEAIEI